MKKKALALTVFIILTFTSSIGCAQGAAGLAIINNPAGKMPYATLPRLTDKPFIPTPVAISSNAVMNHLSEIDVSNTQDGYIMVRYLGKSGKTLKVVIKGPGGTAYIYNLRADGEYEVLPLSEGNGYYQIMVCENVTDNKYALIIGTTQSVHLTDEFAPFIRPNQYVNYTSGSMTAKKAAELTKDAKSTIDKIAAIYSYIIKNIAYDQQLADSVQRGYIPDVDKVMQKGKGICFDYAAVMAAMLRSQGIPAKLVVGYRGNDYHAWVSAYSNETGWVDGSVYFGEKGWTLMDPTFASVNDNRKGISKQTGNNYATKYIY